MDFITVNFFLDDNLYIFSILVNKFFGDLYLVCSLIVEQITGETVGEVRLVADMHQRKAEMARYSDCFIALPGLPLSFSLGL